MSVYIKGMEMPTNCAQCACCDDDARFCHAAHKYIPMIGKPKFCPLVEAPTHDKHTETHGVCLDTISRQDTIDAIEHVTWYHQNRSGQMVSGANSDEHQAWYKAEDVYEAIEAVPTANKSGNWSFVGDNMFECANCKVAYTTAQLNALRNYDKDPYMPNFCPNCGADMRGGDDD